MIRTSDGLRMEMDKQLSINHLQDNRRAVGTQISPASSRAFMRTIVWKGANAAQQAETGARPTPSATTCNRKLRNCTYSSLFHKFNFQTVFGELTDKEVLEGKFIPMVVAVDLDNLLSTSDVPS